LDKYSTQDSDAALSLVLADYFDQDQPASELRVTFHRCTFTNNRFAGPPAQPALVVGNGRQNRLNFRGCLFANNDIVSKNPLVRLHRFLVVILVVLPLCIFLT
jgi:hypothetical protein